MGAVAFGPLMGAPSGFGPFSGPDCPSSPFGPWMVRVEGATATGWWICMGPEWF
jgi:hypothetical protein